MIIHPRDGDEGIGQLVLKFTASVKVLLISVFIPVFII